MLTLRPMTEEQFTKFRAESMEDYAQERARNSGLPIEIERDIAEKQYAELLKDGVQTQGTYLWKIIADSSEPVGDLWVAVYEDRKEAFIFLIEIATPHRSRGYAGQALDLLETELASLGIHQI